MSPLAGAFLTVHTPRYCTLEAAYEGKLASEVFRPVRDGLVAQGEVVGQAGLDVTVINSCHLITTFPTVVDGTPRHQGVLTAQEAPELIHGVGYDYPGDYDLAARLIARGAPGEFPEMPAPGQLVRRQLGLVRVDVDLVREDADAQLLRAIGLR